MIQGSVVCAQTISGYEEVMKERNPDWHVVAKKMMSDVRLFNAKFCDLESDNKNQLPITNVQNTCSMKAKFSSVASLQYVDASNAKNDNSCFDSFQDWIEKTHHK